MSKPFSFSLLVLTLCTGAQAEPGKTIEGFWQDTGRRMLYSRAAPPAYVYGNWDALDQDQTYPAAKEIRRAGAGLEIVDLSYDDENHLVRTLRSSDDSLEFARTVKWTGCTMHHKCRLDGREMFCALENMCSEGGRSVLDWRGEERYARRASCERLGKVQAQGIPVACR